jgi:predicted nuclease of predicted toxin-antitoxin system
VASFYADEQFPFVTSSRLRELGHNVLTVQAAGKSNQKIPDPEVLAFAIEQRRAVITLNRRDFIRLHNQNAEHAGIIVCKDDSDKILLAERIHAAIQAILQEKESLGGQLIRVNKPG